MTRFQKEVNDLLGDYWVVQAKREAASAVKEADDFATVESDGAIKWNNNDAYIPDDFCEKLEYMGYPFSREATKAKRDAQVAKELADYRANYTGPSEEEIAEMRATFGEGEEIVDVITGRTIKL